MVISPKLLLLGILGASGAAIGGGMAFFSSGSKGSETSNVSTSSSSPSNKRFSSPRKNKITSTSNARTSDSGCVIYWVDDVYQDEDSTETSFDTLKHTYNGKDAFFTGAGIGEDKKNESPFLGLCDDGLTNYFYVWQEEDGEWDRTTGGKYSGDSVG